MLMRKVAGLAVLGVAFGFVSQSCSSDPAKKKVGPTFTPDAGAAGESGGGTNGMSGGATGTSGSTSTGGAGDTAGAMATAGESNAGAAGSGTDCPAGFGECNGNLTDLCEQSLNLVTSCGSCTTTCASTHGAAACVDEKCVLTCADGYADCDGNASTGCEALLANNDANCGACGRNCAALGATCKVDMCSAIPLQAVGALGPRNWQFSALGNIFMGSYGNYQYAVDRFPLDGGAELSIWPSTNTTSKTAGTESLLVSGTDAYWSELGTPSSPFSSGVFKKSIGASASTLPTAVFAPEWGPQFLRQQGNAMYWASNQQGDAGAFIYTRNVSADDTDHGTKIVSVDQGVGALSAFNVTSNALYWVSSHAGTGTADELRTAPIAGGTPTAVPEVLSGVGTAIKTEAADQITPVLLPMGDTLYFTRNIEDAHDGIYSFKKGDTKPTQVVATTLVTTMLVDDKFVYYALRNDASLYEAPVGGGAGVKIMSGAQPSWIVGQDQSFVYYYVLGGAPGLYKVAK
jgi:hypothetical protein